MPEPRLTRARNTLPEGYQFPTPKNFLGRMDEVGTHYWTVTVPSLMNRCICGAKHGRMHAPECRARSEAMTDQ